ncbi:MAG TPA: response regulator transcription factor [Candidatus Bipolaricaulota bacterium]
MQKVLVVDDEAKLVRLIQAYLQEAGFKVVTAFDGSQALQQFERESPDLIVLDLMLPQLDGLEVARRVRQKSNVPIIMLTARVAETERVVGLELGADDYVTKPFSPRELVARVRAVLRRGSHPPAAQKVESGRLRIDVDGHQASIDGHAMELTPSEFTLLLTMAQQPGRAFTRRQLMEAITASGYATVERAIDTHIKNLRRKIEDDPVNPCYIHTVRGVGYKFQG